MSVYLLAAVAENAVADEADEMGNLIEENNVQFEDGETLVFADATLDSTNVNSGVLMVVPATEYDNGQLQGYYYGQFRISGAVTDDSVGKWINTDKVTVTVIFNIVPCAG